jgi:hypothetical protein
MRTSSWFRWVLRLRNHRRIRPHINRHVRRIFEFSVSNSKWTTSRLCGGVHVARLAWQALPRVRPNAWSLANKGRRAPLQLASAACPFSVICIQTTISSRPPTFVIDRRLAAHPSRALPILLLQLARRRAGGILQYESRPSRLDRRARHRVDRPPSPRCRDGE